MVPRIVTLEGVAEIAVASDNIVVPGSSPLLWFGGLDAKDASAHLRRTVDTPRRAAKENPLSLKLETSLNFAPRDRAGMIPQEFGAASEGG